MTATPSYGYSEQPTPTTTDPTLRRIMANATPTRDVRQTVRAVQTKSSHKYFLEYSADTWSVLVVVVVLSFILLGALRWVPLWSGVLIPFAVRWQGLVQ